jgi:hypothetical protein
MQLQERGLDAHRSFLRGRFDPGKSGAQAAKRPRNRVAEFASARLLELQDEVIAFADGNVLGAIFFSQCQSGR